MRVHAGFLGHERCAREYSTVSSAIARIAAGREGDQWSLFGGTTRRTPVKKLVIAAALAAFAAGIALPVVIGQDTAYAAGAKKKSMSTEKMKKKKPTGKM